MCLDETTKEQITNEQNEHKEQTWESKGNGRTNMQTQTGCHTSAPTMIH